MRWRGEVEGRGGEEEVEGEVEERWRGEAERRGGRQRWRGISEVEEVKREEVKRER